MSARLYWLHLGRRDFDVHRSWSACHGQEAGAVGETDAQGRLAVGTADASLTVVAGAFAGGGTGVKGQNGGNQGEEEG